MKLKAITLLVLLLCGVTALAQPATKKEKKKKNKKGETAMQATLYKAPDYDLVLKTNMGDMKVKLYVDEVPVTAHNFAFLAQKGFYNGTLFHRVIPQFMIQGGDPDSKTAKPGQRLGESGPGYSFADEFNPNLKHDKMGVLSMANSGPATNGSQFFITEVATPWLNNKHSIFGQVVEGRDVIAAITAAPRDAADRPNTDIIINNIEFKDAAGLFARLEAALKAAGKTAVAK